MHHIVSTYRLQRRHPAFCFKHFKCEKLQFHRSLFVVCVWMPSFSSSFFYSFIYYYYYEWDLFLFLDSFRKKKKKKYIFVLFLLLLIKFEQFVTNCHSIRIVCRCWRPDSLSGIFYFEQNYRRWSGRNFKLPKCFSWRRKYYYVFSSSSYFKRCFSLVWVWDFDL